MFEMHPSEMKNLALAAAATAERDGFPGTADAWVQIAMACAAEARAMLAQAADNVSFDMARYSTEAIAALLAILQEKVLLNSDQIPVDAGRE